jgi:hypothetical protein
MAASDVGDEVTLAVGQGVLVSGERITSQCAGAAVIAPTAAMAVVVAVVAVVAAVTAVIAAVTPPGIVPTTISITVIS